MSNKISVICPAAGEGTRMREKYNLPKPLIPILGKTLIQWSIDSLGPQELFNYIFIIKKEHDREFDLSGELIKLYPDAQIILLDKTTDGAARTVLMAKDLVNNDNECIVTNCDQYYEYNCKDFLNECRMYNAHGILTFEANHPKWSYAKVDDYGYITEVAEKQVISSYATVGIYYFRSGSDMVWAAETMINKKITHNSEYYFCPCYSQLLERGDKVIPYNVNEMCGLGTCEDVDNFITKL